MSKSLGNGLLVTEVLERWRPVELRYYLACAHYRSTIEFSEDALADAAAAYRRIEIFIARAEELGGPRTADAEVPAEFAAAMDDDFGVATALGVLHSVLHRGNAAVDANDAATAQQVLGQVLAMAAVLGLDPRQWAEPTSGADLGAVVELVLDQREQARIRKDFAAADQIRKQLTTAGIEVEDTPGGPRWSLRHPTRANNQDEGM
jgi:cysteinyl-tRNA synthetase